MDSGSKKTSKGLADSLDEKSRALRVSEVSGLLNVSERQVYKLVAEHSIPCFRIGGSIRFDPFAISTWLRQKMPPPLVDHAAGAKSNTTFNGEIREQRRLQ
jgi:excisionase family DNA binding protein